MIDSHGLKNEAGVYILPTIDSKDFKIIKKLGAGASGSVLLAKYLADGSDIAIKAINIYDENKRKQFKNDVHVLYDHKCPFLVKMHGIYYEEAKVKMLLEYMNLGSLEGLTKKFQERKTQAPCVPEIILAKMTHQMLQGLLYLHRVKHQIHRDIKPANILVNTDGIIKLTDFGITKTLECTSDFSVSYVGTKNYMSPERIEGKPYSYASDIWSLGLVIFELASGKFPFMNDKNDMLMLLNALLYEKEPRLPCDGTYSNALQSFIERCLQRNPEDRDTVVELVCHPWIREYAFEEGDVAKWLSQLYGYRLIG